MLAQLTISNFAIIGRLEAHFAPGLNILSGETGAGKSIIINAVNLILGGRASSDLVRSGEQEARVEALFEVPEGHPVNGVLAELGISSGRELLIGRTISREGRNRVWINGSTATLQMLSRIGAMLISISGQHENQLLLRPENHLHLLDDFGGLSEERRRLNEIFDSYQSLKDAVKRLRGEIEAREEREELAEFQKKEIEMAKLVPGEDKELEEERRRLRHAQELIEILNDVYQTLYEKEDAVISALAHCLRGVERGAEVEKGLGPVRDALANARIELEDIALELRDMRETITVDPEALERVEERIQLVNRLKRKYGSTIEEILDFKDRLSRSVAGLEEKRRELEEMRLRMDETVGELHKRGVELSKKRRQVAKLLENAVMEELRLLDMSGTRFRVRFHELETGTGGPKELVPRHLRSDGYDSLELMLSPNIGEDLKPLYRVASGGELSRIMLALKTILARTASIETVVFDEVDSGIGGATAEVVGEKLQALARHHQILCITHLPQIASKGSSHFLVKKEVIKGRTQTTISRLEKEEERIREIARLLGGKVVSKEALAHAREMLN
ncbi:MAG: DNA repair protein RecN [Deltaproteobacteria bacterium]|nr:DNA repair protein RecN [Deltaproteobacteria bacterium]